MRNEPATVTVNRASGDPLQGAVRTQADVNWMVWRVTRDTSPVTVRDGQLLQRGAVVGRISGEIRS